MSPWPPGFRERWARSVSRSTPFTTLLFALFLGAILAYGAAFAWYMIDRFDLVNLIRDVNYDDAFYYFQIASHMAGGEFSTFDGGITRTNGYHPLWLFMITPLYWAFDKTEVLFAIKAFEIMLVAGGVALIAGAARVARLPWILLFAALPTLYWNTTLFKGMEAAAAAFLLGLFLLTLCLFARAPTRWRWLLAAVAFALPLVRLEYVAISTAATGALCLLEWSYRGRVPLGERPRSLLSVRAGVPFLASVAGLLMYFVYNAIVFGGILPVSAAVKALWMQHAWERDGGYSLTENFHDVLQMDAFDKEVPLALVPCGLLFLVWWCTRRTRAREDQLLLAFLVGVFGLAAGHLAKFAQSVLFVHPQFGGLHPWYFVPAYLMEVVVVPACCYVAIWFIRRSIAPKPLRKSRILSLGIVMIGAVFLFAKFDFAAPFRIVDFQRQALHNGYAHLYMDTMVMNRLLSQDSVIGSWDSGVHGYFSRFPVVNLDGLVNSYKFLSSVRALRSPFLGLYGEAAPLNETVSMLLQRYRITHCANVMESSSVRHGTVLFERVWSNAKKELNFRIWRCNWLQTAEDEVDRSEWFWERMAPHFERQTDGVGLFVDGRVAQAFAKDCTPDKLAAWTWGPAYEETVFTPWTKTSIGFCTRAVVLPHDAPPTVRAAAMTKDEYLANRVGERLPAIRSNFDVYLVENRLVYVKERCGQDDVDARFFLHVDPVVPDDLPGPRRRHGFDNLDFRFDQYGWKLEGTCLVEVPLPEYGIAAIRTGQYMVTEEGFHHIWKGEIRVVLPHDAPPAVRAAAMTKDEYLANRVGERLPAIRSNFDVYLVENRLVYVKERCGQDDVDARFFLHVDPVVPDDLPGPRRRHGFDNLDFRFDQYGWKLEGTCLVEVPLPEYGIAAIRTGQYMVTEEGFHHIWKGEIHFE